MNRSLRRTIKIHWQSRQVPRRCEPNHTFCCSYKYASQNSPSDASLTIKEGLGSRQSLLLTTKPEHSYVQHNSWHFASQTERHSASQLPPSFCISQYLPLQNAMSTRLCGCYKCAIFVCSFLSFLSFPLKKQTKNNKIPSY